MMRTLFLAVVIPFSITCYVFIYSTTVCPKTCDMMRCGPPASMELKERLPKKQLVTDLVITYVNGSEENFQRNLRDAKLNLTKEDLLPFSAVRNRFADNDDLRFLLRSVDMYGEVFRKIFLVVADERQVPNWLNASAQGGRLEIVYHRDIWYNQSHLPNFNSLAIEANLHHINGLAEYYVYANDDVAFLAPAVADDFFQANELGELMSFTARPSTTHYAPSKVYRMSAKEAHYMNPVVHSLDLLQSPEVCGMQIYNDFQRIAMPQHSAHAFIKSALERAEQIPIVREALERTWASKLRSGREINVVHFFANYARCRLHVDATIGSQNESIFLHLGESIVTMEEYESSVENLVALAGRLISRPSTSTATRLKYLCVNDNTPDEENADNLYSKSYSNILRVWRKTLFSKKSKFEMSSR